MSAQMAQALTIEEGIQLLNQGAGRLEQAQQPEAAAQLRALAANLTDVDVGEICPQCGYEGTILIPFLFSSSSLTSSSCRSKFTDMRIRSHNQ